jgi:hypothetical protein
MGWTALKSELSPATAVRPDRRRGRPPLKEHLPPYGGPPEPYRHLPDGTTS